MLARLRVGYILLLTWAVVFIFPILVEGIKGGAGTWNRSASSSTASKAAEADSAGSC